jgi:signal transduction histidine kinase
MRWLFSLKEAPNLLAMRARIVVGTSSKKSRFQLQNGSWLALDRATAEPTANCIRSLHDETTVKKTSQENDSSPIKKRPSRSSGKSARRLSQKTVHSIAPSDTLRPAIAVHAENDSNREAVSEAVSNGSETLPRSNRPNPKSLPIAKEYAFEFSFRLMEIAIQHQTFSLAPTGTTLHSLEIEELLANLEKTCRFAVVEGQTLDRLKWLVLQASRGRIFVCKADLVSVDDETNQKFMNALHCAIASLSSQSKFESAVEHASQRAIYNLAYGLSHEINNPLANIAARAQQLISSASNEKDRRSLATIVDQSMRAHEMLAEMMRAVQPRPIALRTDDVTAIVAHACKHTLTTCDHMRNRVEFRMAAKPLYAQAEKESLSEAVSCILQNAFQVCRPLDRIEVICQEVDYNPHEYASGQRKALKDETRNSIAAPDASIRVAIRDTGPGISAKTAECAWDLYFSGREHGRGLGISLANVKRIVDAHHGAVWIESTPNAGCTVEIRLPKIKEPGPARRSLKI